MIGAPQYKTEWAPSGILSAQTKTERAQIPG